MLTTVFCGNLDNCFRILWNRYRKLLFQTGILANLKVWAIYSHFNLILRGTDEILKRPHGISLSLSQQVSFCFGFGSSGFFLPCQSDRIHSLPRFQKTHSCSQYICCVFMQYTYVDYYFHRSSLSVYRLHLPIIVQSPALLPSNTCHNQPISHFQSLTRKQPINSRYDNNHQTNDKFWQPSEQLQQMTCEHFSMYCIIDEGLCLMH